MDWLNRLIDEPLLQGAASILRKWHIHTRQAPSLLEPIWSLATLSILLVLALHFIEGRGAWLSAAALLSLSVPSIRKLVIGLGKDRKSYDVRQYKAAKAQALRKREHEWAVRMTTLFAAACLPFIAGVDDPTGAHFMLGASLWFVLTAPVKFYLEAAEPPEPSEGDFSYRQSFQFGLG